MSELGVRGTVQAISEGYVPVYEEVKQFLEIAEQDTWSQSYWRNSPLARKRARELQSDMAGLTAAKATFSRAVWLSPAVASL